MTSPDRPFADSAAREAISTELAATIFVDAGAGSGKTRELVQRIISLVTRDGVPISRIAAITFTDAAAAELRERVRSKLEEALTGQAMPESEDGPCQRALREIDSAPIQTLHAFAQRILSLYPLEARLPPRIEVLDEVESGITFGREWVRFRERLFEDGCGDPEAARAVRRGLLLGLSERHLRAIAWELHQSWHRLGATPPEPAPMPTLEVEPILDPLDAAAALHDGSTSDRALQFIEASAKWRDGLREAAEDFRAGDDRDRPVAEDRVLRLLNDRTIRLSTKSRGDHHNWGGKAGKAEMADLTALAQENFESLKDRIRRSVLESVMVPIHAFVLEYAERRRRNGRLEFHDLLVLARDLLRDHPEVAAAGRRRYSHLLIDEFQDTDPLQIEIAVLIAGDRPWSPGDWNQVPVPAGRLFFVGDPKQSIYRFRNADIDLYLQARERFGSAIGRLATLTQNFRSSPEVIAFANAVFSRMFASPWLPAGERTAVQVPFEGLVANRREARGSVRVFGKALGEKINADEVRKYEAEDLARAISGMIAAGVQVNDGKDSNKDEVWRPARLSDITILIPSRNVLPAIERALAQREIPARIESRSLLFTTQEVRDLQNILSAIDDPSDHVAVVAALRTPGLGCSDRDLFEWRNARWGDHNVQRTWDYTYRDQVDAPCPSGAAAVQQAMTRLAALHDQRWWLDPGEIVDRVIREFRLMELAFASRRPRDWWQRLRFVHDYARSFADSGGRSLREFIAWMRDQEESGARAVESAVQESDDEAVRIMTIHAAKGLEFPIVFVVGLDSGVSNQNQAVLWEPGQKGFEANAGTKQTGYFRTGGYEDLATYHQAMERLEDDRLLYVAVTRARDHLVVSRFSRAQAKPHADRHATFSCSMAECLSEVLDECPDVWQPLELREFEHRRPAPPIATKEDSAERFAAWKAEHARIMAQRRRLPATSATALNGSGHTWTEEVGDQEEPPAVEFDDPPWRRGRGGTSVGRAVHAVLQTMDLRQAGEQEIKDAAAAQARAESIPGSEDDVRRLVEVALHAPSVQEAVGGRFWREVPVGVPLPNGGILEGFIDLLYEGPDGLIVVDYKTDAIRSDAEADEKRDRYRLQGAAYAYALGRALNREVARVVFLFLTESGPKEREILDLPAAIADAAERSAAVIAAAASA